MTAASSWTKSDWRAKPRVQMPDYLDADALSAVDTETESLEPNAATAEVHL